MAKNIKVDYQNGVTEEEYIYIHRYDNGLPYEDGMVIDRYFKTYMDAYEDIINTLHKEHCNSELEEDECVTRSIIRITLNTNESKEISVYSYSTKEWEHCINNSQENFNRIYEMQRLIPMVFNGCGEFHIDNYLFEHNSIVLEEKEGYEIFCKRTLYKYLLEQKKQYYKICEHHHNRWRRTEISVQELVEIENRIREEKIIPLADKIHKLMFCC